MKQSSDLTSEFNSAPAITPAPAESIPVTKQRHDELDAQLSQPHLTVELTPQGSLFNEIRSENDRRIAAELEYIRVRLDRRRNRAVDNFHMAHDGPQGSSLRPRMKM